MSDTFYIKIFCVLSILFLSACFHYTGVAPVRDVNTHQVGKVLYYTVQPGETLYAVAWRYELDYQKLAELNDLTPPYAIHPGQRLRLSGTPPKIVPSKKVVAAKITYRKKVAREKIYKQTYETNQPVRRWLWPAKGKVVNRFSGLNKGVNIAGKFNESVVASANGQVVYAGDGIRGYGNLIIIKHNKTYLTAYAYNRQLLVKTGSNVRAGQQIARMGKTNTGKVLLHFEIRRNGKPINPISKLA